MIDARVILLLATGALVAFGQVEADAGVIAADDATELDLFKMEEVWNAKVVTASRGVEEDSVSAAANVYVISREDITAHRWRSLSEMLSNVPGLYVIDDFAFSSVGVRGITGGPRAGSRIVKVMINGVEVSFRPDLTALLGPEFLPVEVIERVEVARGPLSALYGANAFLATVNVITRKVTDKTGKFVDLARYD